MEKHIKDAMNDEIIKQAAKHFGISFESIKRLGGFENFIYEYEKEQSEFVLRFVHSTHRSFEFVYAELEFIDYLSKNGANVSTVVHSLSDEIIVKIPTENGEYFSVSAFTKAPGTYVQRNDITEEFVYEFGKSVGKLHQLTKEYKPVHKRYHWHEEDYIDIGKRNVPKDKWFIVEKAIDHTKKLREYKESSEDYGLIHTDLHFGNMYYDGKNITFFDWDDASYKHFISDIAIIIFYLYGMSSLTDEEIEDKTIWFLKPFMKGYETENTLDKFWFEQLNEFLKLREIILALVLYAAMDGEEHNEFIVRFFDKFESRIKNDTPFFNLDRVLKELWSL